MDDEPDVPPGWDEEAMRIVDGIERAIQKLDLACQGEFISLTNALLMQLESGRPVPSVIDDIARAILSLTEARGVDAKKLRLADRLRALSARVTR
jgi:hypothetical protein